jgi:DNA-binding transcriptional LysR family regulator
MPTPFRHFQAFHAVMQKGTVTAAAEHLGVSQPAISNLLAQLERQTKIRLFERAKGRLVPTPEAAVLFDEIDTVVRGLDHVNQAVVDLHNQKAGQLQVASTHALAFGFMPREIAEFVRDRPNLTIAFTSQYSAKIQEWVMAGLFEIGICERPIRHDGLTQHDLSFETLVTLPSHNPLAAHKVLTPALLDDTPFIVMGADHMVSRRLRETFHLAGANFRVRSHTDLFRNALSLVKTGLGAALIDPFTLAADSGDGYVVRPLEPSIRIDLAVITARGKPLSTVGQDFLEQILPRMEAMASSVPSTG